MDIFKGSDIWFFGGVLAVIVALALVVHWRSRKQSYVPHEETKEHVDLSEPFVSSPLDSGWVKEE